LFIFFFFQAEDGIRDFHVTGVQTCALPISIVLWVGAYKYAFEILRASADGRDDAPEVVATAETGTVLRFLAMQLVFVFALLAARSEEHTSELQSRENLVCRLLLEKNK